MTPDQLAVLFGDTTLMQAIFWILAVAALVVVIVKLWGPIRRAVHTIEALGELPEVVKLVHHEFTPNSGTSFKDFQNRTDARFRAIERRLGLDPDRDDLEETR